MRGTSSCDAFLWQRGKMRRARDSLAVEEPLEIRLGGRRFTITMRTPGNDKDLIAGFLLSEGFIANAQEIGDLHRVRADNGAMERNVVDVILSIPADSLRQRLQRNFTMSSSCGLCGRTTIESLQRRIAPLKSGHPMSVSTLQALASRLRGAQKIFAATGGLHGAALFDRRGHLLTSGEDIGRHNAVDKVVGRALLDKIVPSPDLAMMVSGRLSFEIVQKAAVAGIGILAAVSAPSSLAVQLARRVRMTLVGFLRGDSFNVYAGAQRIINGAPLRGRGPRSSALKSPSQEHPRPKRKR